MAPEDLPWKGAQHFGGRITALTLLRTTLTDPEVRQLAMQVPNPQLIQFEEGSKPWPIQTREQAGYSVLSGKRCFMLFYNVMKRVLPYARRHLSKGQTCHRCDTRVFSLA